MRTRLFATFVGLVVVIVALYGAPRALIRADEVREQHRREILRVASTAADRIARQIRRGEEVQAADLATLLGPAEAAEYRPAAGETVRTGALHQDDRSLRSSRTTIDGGTVVVSRSGAAVGASIRDAVLPIAVLGIAVLALAIGLAWWLTGRLARPFQELASVADGFARGRLDLDVPASSLPEAEAIGRGLRTGLNQMDVVLRREREFSANASHQLRTPLTAMRLRIEDLTYWPEVDEAVRPELEAVLGEIDRLAETVTSLLDMSRRGQLADIGEFDVSELVTSTVARWKRFAELQRRTIEMRTDREVRVRSSPSGVGHILDILIDNALSHGQGTIVIEVSGDADHARLRVQDEGPGISAVDADRILSRAVKGGASEGQGIGLALAADLAATLGGRLVVGTTTPTRFDLMLPNG